MLEGSIRLDRENGRPLTTEERALLKKMVGVDRQFDLEKMRVIDANDGNMGGIRFVSNDTINRRFGKEISAANYSDIDGISVSISINVDQKGNLFEVDFWKVDFSALKKYPGPEDILVVDRNKNEIKI